jgi:hypothetical protein
MTLPVVPQNVALAAVAVWCEQVECTLAVEVSRYDGCCPFCREGFPGGKTALPSLRQMKLGVGRLGHLPGWAVREVGMVAAVGGHDVRIAVAV